MKGFALILILSPSLLFAAADLEIQNLRGVIQQDGKNIQISFFLTNHGPQAASNLGSNVYMYQNERLIVSQSVSLLPLISGERREENFATALPGEPVTGIKVEVFDSVEPDIQPSTNFLQINLKPPDYKRIDLQISEANWDPSRSDGGKKGLHAKLRNNGPERSGFSRLTIELVIFQNVVAKVEKRIERLESGEEMEINMPAPDTPTISAPEGVLRLKWESTDSTYQDDQPQNNSYDLPIALNIKLPDLVPLGIRLDKQGRLNFMIQNKGNARAQPSVTALYINGALVNRFDTNQLQPKASQQFRFADLKLQEEAKITIVADFNADVEESSETNNRLEFQKTTRPDSPR